jgi:hypothetical protein
MGNAQVINDTLATFFYVISGHFISCLVDAVFIFLSCIDRRIYL